MTPPARDVGRWAVAAARGVRIETATDDGDAVVDRQTVERVLRELVDNAVRFAQVDGCVRIEARRMSGGGSRFSVTDDGNGLPGGDRARIFEPFASGPADLPEQHGLGLYITRALVLGHGGRLLAEDAPGGGGHGSWSNCPVERPWVADYRNSIPPAPPVATFFTAVCPSCSASRS